MGSVRLKMVWVFFQKKISKWKMGVFKQTPKSKI